MIVLLDSDVLIDLALDRRPHSGPSGALIDALERRPGSGFIAWHTISNFYYLVAPGRGRDVAREFLLRRAPGPPPTRIPSHPIDSAVVPCCGIDRGARLQPTRWRG